MMKVISTSGFRSTLRGRRWESSSRLAVGDRPNQRIGLQRTLLAQSAPYLLLNLEVVLGSSLARLG
jgi:hypothetical protein